MFEEAVDTLCIPSRWSSAGHQIRLSRSGGQHSNRSAPQHLSFLVMPKQSRTRIGKRKRPPEQIPSSQSLEVVSSVRRGDRATKQRVVEKLDFEPPPPIPLPDDSDTPASGSHADPSNPVDLTQLVSDATSRSVSVSVVCICHVTRLPSPSL